MAKRLTLDEKRAAYQATFFGDFTTPHPAAQTVLADLKSFCGLTRKSLLRVSPSDKHTDVPATFHQLGRIELYLRITAMLGLDGETQPNEATDERSESYASS